MDLDETARALRALEPVFHRCAAGSGRAVLEAMTEEDYWEVGASGTVYDRDQVLDVVTARYAAGVVDPAGPMTVTGFAVRRLGGLAWLATYVLHQPGRTTRRATVWLRHDDTWRAAYHQGTVVAG